jgi:predicted RNA polymerase sigma factor
MVALNHAVAVAMVRGPEPGLDLLGKLAADDRIAGDHRLYAVRAHLLDMAGDHAAAREAYLAAAAMTTSFPQQRYLHGRAAGAGRAAQGARAEQDARAEQGARAERITPPELDEGSTTER